jgi:hypothetical protein
MLAPQGSKTVFGTEAKGSLVYPASCTTMVGDSSFVEKGCSCS